MPGPITILPLISAPPKYGEDLLTSYVGIHVEEIALTTERLIFKEIWLYIQCIKYVTLLIIWNNESNLKQDKRKNFYTVYLN